MALRFARRFLPVTFAAGLAALTISACVSSVSNDEAIDASAAPSAAVDASFSDVDTDDATEVPTHDATEVPTREAEGLTLAEWVETPGEAEAPDALDRDLHPENCAPAPASPSLGSFAVYATESIELNAGSLITGCNVGVEKTTGPFLSNGVAASFNSGASIQTTQTLYASSVLLNAGSSVGPIDTSNLATSGNATHGMVSSFPAMPAAPTAPAATAGTTSVTLNSGSKTLGAGAYGAVMLNAGATLTLSGGSYVFSSLTLNSNATLDVTAASTVSITGGASFNSGSFAGPASGSGLTAKALVFYFDSAQGLSLNSGSQVRALVVAPNALLTVNTSKFTGAIAAAQVVMNSGSTVTCQDGLGSLGSGSTCSGSCDDGNACTTDACTAGACTHTPVANGTTCNDGNACTQTDTCQSGTCTGANPVTCTASDSCHTAGTCSPSTGTCSNPIAANGTTCSDGNACTQTDTCQSGTCTGANPVTCTASDQCHAAGTCSPSTGQCSNPAAANGATCNDGNACTKTDTCQSGTCSGANPVTCTASDQCHAAGTCSPSTGVCSNPIAANGTTCSDSNACTQTDSCQSGTCTGTNPVTCTASDSCHTAGTCSPSTGTCSNPVAANGTTCSDGNACTQTDSCQSGTCTGTNPVTCTASDQCHSAGTCSPSTGQCSNPVAANGTTCSDGNACTQTDSCESGTCTGTNPVTCTASDQCHAAGTCSPSTGTCSNPAAANGTTCNDGNACTQTDTCESGTCTGASPVVCVAADQCHAVGTCSPSTGTCSNPNASDGTTCSDGNACTQTDACTAGACVGSNPVTCAAPGTCHTAGTCDPTSGQCSNPTAPDGTTCSDGNECVFASSETCLAGACTGTPHCGGTECVSSQCNASSGQCAPAVAGTPCSAGACDGNGNCGAGTPASGVTYLPPVCPPASSPCSTGPGVFDALVRGCYYVPLPEGTTCPAGVCDGDNNCVPNNGSVDGGASYVAVLTAACPVGGSCTSPGAIDFAVGACAYVDLATGTACSGGACDGNGNCAAAGSDGGVATDAGAGTDAGPSACDDGNPCTADVVKAGGVCAHYLFPDGTSCNDGSKCDSNDTCKAGTCTAGTSVKCTASDACHVAGTCNPSTGACTNPAAADGTTCNDGNGCTQTDVCTAGACVGSNPVTCSASDSCHTAGTCSPSTGTCSNPAAPNGTTCSDGNACTQTDSCQSGTCSGSNPVTCTASDQCHAAGTCDPSSGQCSNPAAANGTTCSDGNACTQTDSCQSGTCTGTNPVTCTASDQCHSAGTCSPSTGTCSNPVAANGTTCNDGNACTQTDSCQSGTCTGTNPVMCTASDQCHAAGTCSPSTGACSNPAAANGTTCNDGNACTQTDTCESGACSGANPVTCVAADQCHAAGTCSPSTGTCSNPALADGTTCTDGNGCTQTDVCTAGACVGSNPVTCTASDQCHTTGTCDPSSGQCSNPAATNGTTCTDGNACTQTDACTAGACVGSSPVTCVAADACHVAGACDPTSGTCSNPTAADGTTCNDGNACTQTDACTAGACVGSNPVTCAAPATCHTAGACDPTSGQCSNPTAPDGTTCSDGNECAFAGSETCLAGACTGTPNCGGTECLSSQCNASSGQCAPAIAGTPCSAGACDGDGNCAASGTPATGVTYLPPVCPPPSSPCSTGPGVFDALVRGCYYVPLPEGTTCPAGVCDGDNNCVPNNGSIDGGASYVTVLLAACPVAGSCTNPGAIDFAVGACAYVDLSAGTACSGGACDGKGDCTAAVSDAGSDAGVTTDAGTDAGPSACDDGNPCTADVVKGGACAHYLFPDGTSCSDGSKCDSNDTCKAGTCTAGTSVKCTASDACHVAGTCNPSTGVCSNPTAADGTTCNDGNACTQTDACTAGACMGSNPVTCSASDSCHTAGTCSPSTGTCSNPAAPNGTTCSDGNACTQSDSCQSGVCTGSNPVVCTAADQCHAAGACDPSSGQCSSPAAANGTTCSDGNACTQSDTCQIGACTGANPVTCVAADACHVAGTCSAATGQCSTPAAPAGAACGNNSNACVGALLCDGAGACVQGPPPVLNTSNPCVVGSCDPVTGVHYTNAAAGTACGTSSDACAGAYTCDGNGACDQGAAPVVDDGNPCTVDACSSSTGVTHTPNPGAACGNNSNLCATTYVCDASAICQTIAPPAISPPNRCTPGACNPSTGVVTYTPTPGCDPNPTTGAVYEAQASLLGDIVFSGGGPATGYTLTAFDDVTTSTPRSDVSLATYPDGSFRARFTTFPTSEPDRTPAHHILVRIDSPSFISVYRDAYVHPGMAVNFGTISVVARDSKITVIDATGGTATDSQGLVQVIIPAGALTAATPIQITPYKHRSDLPYTLPTVTMPGFAMTLEPNGTQFQTPATVRLTNWRNMPTTLEIPVGVLDETRLVWTHEAFAIWDGSAFAFQVQHFSIYDANPPNQGEWVAAFSPGLNQNNSQQQCVGSTFGLGNGTLRQDFPLPGVTRRGQSYAVGLNYDAMLTYGADDSSPPPKGVAAATPTTSTAAGGGMSVKFTCEPKSAAEPGGDSSPSGSCTAGSCSLGASSSMPAGLHLGFGDGSGNTTDTPIPPIGGSFDQGGISVPIPTAGAGSLASSGYNAAPHLTLSEAGGGCTSGGSKFGQVSNAPTRPGSQAAYNPNEPTPIADFDIPTFTYQRHASPYGIGWGVDSVGQLFKNPSSDEVVVVSGSGDQEFFAPRSRVSYFGTRSGGDTEPYALDPVTGQVFRASQPATSIVLVDPTTGNTTPFLSGLTMLSSGPHTMTIGYVNGVRHFLIALEGSLLDVDASGNQRTLIQRSKEVGGQPFVFYVSSAAVVGNYAYYTEGNITAPVLYRFDLTVPMNSSTGPAPVVISAPSGGDSSLTPSGVVSGYTFGEIHGLAPSIHGGLYVSDRLYNAIFELLPDSTGVVSGNSPIVIAIGNGNNHFIPPIGLHFPGAQFSLPQPELLANGPDGILWIFTVYGTIAYDPVADAARWLVFGSNLPGSENNFNFSGVSVPGSFIPVGPLTIFGDNGSAIFRVDVDNFSSQTDPTRTVTYSINGSTLTDTTRDYVEAYDSGGRLLERSTREGDPLFSVTYVGATNIVAAITDPLGGAMTFAYASSAYTITDPAGRVTTVTLNDDKDVASFTEPDGETWSFTYLDHRMQSKTSPEGDLTQYAYTNGALTSVTKPAGETMTMTPGFSQTPVPDANGNPTFTTTYTDYHGVVHTVTLDDRGRILSEQYTADGVAYAVQHNRVTMLGDAETALQQRNNHLIGRDYRVLVNGLAMGLDNDYDDLGRWYQDAMTLNGTGGQDVITYDVNGRVATMYDGANDSFKVTRDANGHLLKIAELGGAAGLQPTGRELDYTWTNGLVATSTAHGVTTTYTYDPSTSNVASTVDTMGRTSAFTYDPAGNVLTANDGTTTWTFAHDANNRLITATDQEGNVTTLSYKQMSCGCSEASRLTSLHTPDLQPAQAWAFTYLPEGRLGTMTDPDGFAEIYGYETTGELKTLTDRNGHTTTMTHDHLGRVLSIIDPLLRAHSRAYAAPASAGMAGQDTLSGSASGTAASTNFAQALNVGDYQIGTSAFDTQAGGGSVNHTRGWADVEFYRDATFQLSYGRNVDEFGRTTLREDRPSSQLTSLTALPTGSGALAQDQTGYDINLPAPLLTGESSPASTSTSNQFSYTTEYDVSTASGEYGNNGAQGFTYTYTRDTAGRVTNVHTHNNVQSPVFDFDQAYSYFPTGQLQTSPQGAFTYDDRGLVKTRTVTELNKATFAYVYGTSTVSGYDALGRNTLLTYPDGHQRVQAYDSEGRITSRCYEYPAGGIAARCYTAMYDGAGNPVQLGDPEGTDTVVYDALDRVNQRHARAHGADGADGAGGVHVQQAGRAEDERRSGDRRPTTAPQWVRDG